MDAVFFFCLYLISSLFFFSLTTLFCCLISQKNERIDVVEVRVNIGGYNVLLCDTAGIHHDTQDMLEHMGMAKTKEVAHEADMILCMFDAGTIKQDLNNINSMLIDSDMDRDRDRNTTVLQTRASTIVAANKMDLIQPSSSKSLASLDSFPIISLSHSNLPTHLRNTVQEQDIHCISCHDNDGINELMISIERNLCDHFNQDRSIELGSQENTKEPFFITRERHRHHLIECEEMLANALVQLETAGAIELAAEDLRLAGSALGRIGGKIDPEEILDAIFLEFCIGK